MKKKKKPSILAIIVMLIGIILIVIGCSIVIKKGVNKKQSEEKFLSDEDLGKGFVLANKKKIDACKNNKCSRMLFGDIIFKKDIPAVKQKLDSINKNTWKLYDKIINSEVKKSSCYDYLKNDYNYSTRLSNLYYVYSNSNYVTFSVNRYFSDLCQGSDEAMPTESFFYSIKEDKMLTKDEIITRIGLDEEDLQQTIKDGLLEYFETTEEEESIDDLNSAIIDYSITYDKDGNIILIYEYDDNINTIVYQK